MNYYGMRLRGYSPGAQPAGCVRRLDDKRGVYWDIIAYERRLTPEEVIRYSLDELSEDRCK